MRAMRTLKEMRLVFIIALLVPVFIMETICDYILCKAYENHLKRLFKEVGYDIEG